MDEMVVWVDVFYYIVGNAVLYVLIWYILLIRKVKNVFTRSDSSFRYHSILHELKCDSHQVKGYKTTSEGGNLGWCLFSPHAPLPTPSFLVPPRNTEHTKRSDGVWQMNGSLETIHSLSPNMCPLTHHLKRRLKPLLVMYRHQLSLPVCSFQSSSMPSS